MISSPLSPGLLGANAARAGMDPAWVWADATAYRELLRPSQTGLPNHWPVVLELAPGASIDALASAGAQVPPAYRGTSARQLSATIGSDMLRTLLAGLPGAVVQRLELQLPVIPLRARAVPAADTAAAAPKPDTRAKTPPGPTRMRSSGPVLLGVIDCGCPFAHRMLRDASGQGTQVLQIWDQDPLWPAFAASGGVQPPDFGYGLEISRQGLNALMRAANERGRPQSINEALCYERAGYGVLRWSFGHGAAVIGALVAPRPSDDGLRLQPGPARARRAAASAAPPDLVFVQVPRDAVQDSSSASLARYVIDGLRYIFSCAAPGQRIVVNLSDGSSRGAHEGSAIVERAIEALVQEQRAQGRELVVVIAAGNSRDEERHAQLDALQPGQRQRLWLRAPPANETPVHVNLRVPASAAALRVRCTPPGQPPGDFTRLGQAQGWFDAAQAPALAGLVLAQPLPGLPACGLLAIAPTRKAQAGAVAAPAGDWCIEFELDADAAALDESVHLWVSRGQRNSTALPRSRQARFIDTDRRYDPTPHLRHQEQDALPPASAIRRAGTLNALATGSGGRGVLVVGAAYRRVPQPPPYASAGPAAGPAQTARQGPDETQPVDEAPGLPGMRVAGNLSGRVARAVGSSFASPQTARRVALRTP